MGHHKRRPKTARRDAEPAAAEGGGDSGPGERLQKVLAAAGIGSRRDCEELITAGRVEIDKRVVTLLGTRVDPLRQEIRVDGEAIRRPQRLYFAVNKPVDVVTTNFDPSGRPLVIDLVPTEERVFAVGRLDRSSEGLILVTNDGEFANRITHPRYGVEKTYLVRVAGSPGESELARLRKGVYLSDGFCRVQSIVAKSKHKQSTDLIIVLNEGRNRELRRILARVGHKVLKLKRIAVGPIKLADLPVGAWRRLMPAEIESLLALAREKRRAGKGKKKPGGAASKPGGMKLVHGERPESPYQQQQALMAEPLSLEDLLRDDLEEGNLAESPASEGSAQVRAPQVEDDHEDDFTDTADDNFSDESEEIVPGTGRPGDVIDYEDDQLDSPPRKPKPPAPQAGPRGPFTRPHRDKPGGKFRPAQKRSEGHGGDARPAGGRWKKFGKGTGKASGKPAESKFGKRGGKKRVKAGKKFGTRTEKKFDPSAGRKHGTPAGKKFGKRGGRGKNRP